MGLHNKVIHERIVEMYTNGKSVEEIAEELNRSMSTVRQHLNRAGCAMKHYIDKGKVMALAKAGWKPADIAWDMRITEGEVRQVLAESGGEVCSRI